MEGSPDVTQEAPVAKQDQPAPSKHLSFPSPAEVMTRSTQTHIRIAQAGLRNRTSSPVPPRSRGIYT